MKRKSSLRILAALASIAAISMAGAQGPPEDRQAPPPPPMEGGQHRRLPMMMTGPGILLNPQVQAELKLTDDQTERIQKILPRPPMGPGGPGGFGGGEQGGPPPPPGGFGSGGQGGPPPPPGGFGGGGPGGPPPGFGPGGPGFGGPGGRELEGKIKNVLTASQFHRYHEIDLQLQGPRALIRPEVADSLNLTKEQRDKVRSLIPRGPQFGGPRPPGGFGGGGPNGPPPPPGGFGGGFGGGPGGPGGPPPPGGFGGGGPGGPPPPPGGFGGGFQGGPGGPPPVDGPQGHDQESQKLLAILTAEQKEKWQAMLGKKFEFRPRRPGRE